jgi:putative chitinase
MSDKFRVKNPGGMWLRSEPVVSEETKLALLPVGQSVTKLGDTEKPRWWRIRTTVASNEIEGFGNKNLMESADSSPPAPSDSMAQLVAKTLAVLAAVAPTAHPNYLQAIRQGGALFQQHGITTPQRMAHFLAQAMTETGSFKVLRESMNYRAPRIMQIFGIGRHSAKITAGEAETLARNEPALAERVYGLGNPRKARELGNNQPGDGFRFRGNGVLQMTGRGAHRRHGAANGLDLENNPELATLPEHALKPALQEWSDGNLNRFADVDDIRKITLKINGGLNGFPERKAFFARLHPMLKA